MSLTPQKKSPASPSAEKPAEKKSRRTGIVIAAAVILSAAAVILGSGVWYISSKLDRLSYVTDSSVTPPVEVTEPLEAEEGVEVIPSGEAPEGSVFKDGDIVNILFIGTDGAFGGPYDPGRADCTMLCSLNKATGDVKLISFERGIYVKFDVWPYEDILTHTYAWGGSQLVFDTISKYFLVDMTGYIHADFDAFTAGIDALGGVDVELTEKEALALGRKINTGSYTDAEGHVGVYHLNGQDALAYCRLRFIDSNWKRIERQRNTIQAALNAAKGMSLKELDRAADTVLPLIETNLSKSDIASLLFNAAKFAGAEAGQMTVPDHNPGETYSRCDFTYESQKIRDFIYGKDSDSLTD